MSEDDQKPRVRVRITGDPPAIFNAQARIAALSAGIGESLTKRLTQQIAAVNQQALAALAKSLTPQIDFSGITREILAESFKPRMDFSGLAEALTPRIAEMMDALKPSFERLHEMWETALPPNWREFEKADRVTEILNFMEETGWSLAWVPRPSVIDDLLAATDSAARGQALLAHEAEVLDDLDLCLAEITDADLAETLKAATEAVGSYRDGRVLAAQALATCLFTTLIHVNLEHKTFGAARDAFTEHDPMHVNIGRFRLVAIQRSAGRAIDKYMGEPGEPIPTTFNRHASTHRVGATQYTRLNSLTSLLLVVSLLRELDFWGARERASLVGAGLLRVPWEISGQVGPHSRSGYDGSGWLWEITRGEGGWPQADVRRVFVEISGTARGTDPEHLPRDTADAIATQGQSEVEKVLAEEEPPRVIQCGTDGCYPEQAADEQ